MATGSIALAGTVVEVFEEQKISDNFSKRLIKLDIDEDTDYSQRVTVEFVNDKCGLLNKYGAGDKVVVDVNIRGKDFTKDGKTSNFTKLNGWRIKGFATGGNDPAPQADVSDMPGADPAPQTQAPAGDNGQDDLPF